ncbi:MAG: bifunctional 5,10-methylenetetrahydrofolate dehydrogenase/5,10-methenyltetrahydrofolate cyclohydrolase [Candidatus Omnitrophica bacterium]|nr:bifunctional 5,10-methylenetetrahydrofolate dehydrogenase/5,10-methenyltetrahydrofolate cyclohydrolase [Candidatus Omnitrophota bacterium]
MTVFCRILDGAAIAGKCLEGLRGEARGLTLGTVQAGETKDTLLYSKYLKNLLQKVGVGFQPVVLAPDVPEETLIREVVRLNQDARVTGILIFSPLPRHIQPLNVLDALSARKDVEGRTFLKSHFGVFSPTANAVMALLEATGVKLTGRHAVVVGHSDLVGKPTAVLLMDQMATVVVCHKETRDLEGEVRRADILVVGVGRPNLIKGDWIKKGAVAIDIGENVVDGRLVGDVEFEKAKVNASAITPVPGGVGPLTNVMLIKNLIRLAELNAKRENGNGNH